MRKIILLLIIISLILVSTAVAENLYFYDSLDISLDVNGQLSLYEAGNNPEVSELTTTLLLYPEEDYRQELLSFQSSGEVEENKVVFYWKDPTLGEKDYSFQSLVRTTYHRNQISEKIFFPTEFTEQEIEEEQLYLYLEDSEIIDWNEPSIIAQANELTADSDDYFEVVFLLASWVEENIEYDLNSLTAKSSQKSSWVLENKEGVCDEMTSLFISMCRSQGIPARFVTGVSYTNSPLFAEPWQAHGWAEVYFPNHGWVSFDPTFGEYGYIDSTHVKLKDDADPSEASTLYEWTAHNVNIVSKELDFDVDVVGYGDQIDKEFSLEMSSLGEELAFGSYNLITAIIKNEKEYYSASTLTLTVPEEIQIINNKKQTVLLEPKEVQELYWIIKIPQNLNEGYRYEFPYTISTEKNLSIEDSFFSQKSAVSYTKSEVEDLIPEDLDENSYSRVLVLSCEYQEEVQVNQDNIISCSLKNSGDTKLENLNFCIANECLNIDQLPISKEYSYEVELSSLEAGWKTVFVSAKNDLVQKGQYLTYQVLDQASLEFSYSVSENIHYGEEFLITISLIPDSFTIPQNLTMTITLPGKINTWEISELTQQQDIILEINSLGLGSENYLPLELAWQDEQGNEFSYYEEILVEIESNTFWDKVVMFFNTLTSF
ncbi:MAG: transglutaminase domain-containing protein [archaeon]|nr:transglutaminase domain-containing protein [Nanoarchaeota archaeon]